MREHTTVEKGHGRIESRQYFDSPSPQNIRHLFVDWPGAKSLGQAINVIERAVKQTSEVLSFGSRLEVGVKKFASADRGYWAIKNKVELSFGRRRRREEKVD